MKTGTVSNREITGAVIVAGLIDEKDKTKFYKSKKTFRGLF
jgi:hypothetical protein